MCQPTERSTGGVQGRGGGGGSEKEVVIHFGAYNIQNGRNGGLEFSLCGMAQTNIYLVVLQKNKLTGGVYVWE